MSRPYRPADGRFPLPMAYSEDAIPADPNFVGPTRLSSSRVEPDRQTRVTSRLKDGEIVINLGFCNPVKEKATINRLITDAKLKGPLHLVTIVVESEVLAEPDAYHFFFVRNRRFVRNNAREGELHGQLVFEMKIGEESRGTTRDAKSEA